MLIHVTKFFQLNKDMVTVGRYRPNKQQLPSILIFGSV
jgi:hypothetical protein